MWRYKRPNLKVGCGGLLSDKELFVKIAHTNKSHQTTVTLSSCILCPEVPVKIVITGTRECQSCRHVLLQETEKHTALWPIHVDFAEHWEGDAILVLGKLFYVLIRTSFLLPKLIAWESQYL